VQAGGPGQLRNTAATIEPAWGMNIFVIRGVAGQYASLVEIFKGVTLFLIADLVVVALVIFYPGIVMFMFDS
jgi:TRAP-type mannitol/chloroaromatic compound transport system permease large subunit